MKYFYKNIEQAIKENKAWREYIELFGTDELNKMIRKATIKDSEQISNLMIKD